MKIDKIIKMKDNKYKIYIDGESFITYDNVILDNDLLYKKDIDNKFYNKLINDTKYYDIYNKTVKYILKKKRSEKEINEYLVKSEVNEKDINKIITKLKDIRLINDIEYCKSYINDKVYLSKNGINKIRIDLLEQNIPIEIIEQELKNIDSDILNDRLEKLIIKKINSNKKYSNFHLKQKILMEMINLGYPKEKILQIIDNNLEDDDKIVKREFDKLYTKLKIKYNGYELKNKLKQKLLSKGFDLDIINKLIQEKIED
ncbi:MAG: RecX family transcriptional regulator [Bacilli bacterium]|nr:RecX family transcriptional regulator [Bacilli bacterium]